MRKTVSITARKFDQSIHRTWKCELVTETSEYWLFVGEFDQEISHPTLGLVRRGTISYEYYFKEKWFNVFRFHEPEGEFKFFYCNLNMPPRFRNGVLDYVDLDIDILVQKDLGVVILDEEEFIENCSRLNYPPKLVSEIAKAKTELMSLISRGSFPFDFQ